MYLDCDTTPPRRSRFMSTKRLDRAIEKATSIIVGTTEGQIGIYDQYIHGPFRGYVIKYAGQVPYFEAASDEEAA